MILRLFAVLLLFPVWCVNGDEVFGPGAADPASPKAWYEEGVRPTGPRTPEEELAGFHVPPGFVVELVAAEPVIHKPLNMAFDTRGRLWVTHTVEYPYPAPVDRKSRDSIRILEVGNRDGPFERATTFAEELNIPMGVLPTTDGAIAFSIPNLIFFRDTDHDGHCEQRQTLLGPFDTTLDTHGMINALRLGIDGWVYACHGFNNQSKVKATDGSEVTMSSGNTFRFRIDGSHIEHFTFGQVNPFGMTCDRWGNWFTADCHSKPITQLLRGGCYSSFGRLDDGLGFVPSMMEHLHGSTAISGLEIYDAEDYPEGYRNQFYSGNVMTSRINRNAIEDHGATLRAKELPDFLTSDDPWFRPVDIRLGPDGALYVADFYNKIIGHYEVPLTHPERDRERGRIWRIVYRGKDISTPSQSDLPEIHSDLDDFEELANPNATVRRLARERIQRLDDAIASTPLTDGLQHADPQYRIACGWELTRRGIITNQQRLGLLRDEDAIVRAQAIQFTSECLKGSEELRAVIRDLLDDPNARVVRFAVEAIGRNPELKDLTLLLNRLISIPKDDSILRQSIRIAMRDILKMDSIASEFESLEMMHQDAQGNELAEILLGLRTSRSASWLLGFIKDDMRPIESMLKRISHVAMWSSDGDQELLIELLQRRSKGFNSERNFFLRLHESSGKRSETTRKVLTAWGEKLSETWFHRFTESLGDSKLPVVSWTCEIGEGWPTQARSAKDGNNDERYRSSLVHGEKYTGTMRCDSFPAPEKLGFWLVGHNGHPKEPDSHKNRIRLVDDITQEIIYEAFPPRSDIAYSVEWNLADWKGRSVHIDCIDEDNGKAYAWIGIGRFDYPPLQSNGVQQSFEDGMELLRAVRPKELALRLLETAQSKQLRSRLRCELIEISATISGNDQLSQLALIFRSFDVTSEQAERLIETSRADSIDKIGLELIKQLAIGQAISQQQKLALLLAKQRATLPWLLSGFKEGWLAVETLRETVVMQGIEKLAEKADREFIQAMFASIPSLDEKLEELSRKIVTAIENKQGDLVQGAALFQKHCANCHQLGGQGANVGPQLDGTVARTPSRLLEDIVFPHRNVDYAFRVSTLLIDESRVRVGLLRNETPDFVELIENSGQVARIDIDSISDRKQSQLSLMPSGLQDSIGEKGLIDLVGYLISKRGSP